MADCCDNASLISRGVTAGVAAPNWPCVGSTVSGLFLEEPQQAVVDSVDAPTQHQCGLYANSFNPHSQNRTKHCAQL